MRTFDSPAGRRGRPVLPLVRLAASVAGLAALASASPLAAQQHEHDDHAAEAAERDGRSHAGVAHFTHPLFAESISPDTKMRLDYAFQNPGSESEMELEGEYAFHPGMSVEVGVHVHPSDAALGDTHMLFKFTNDALAERGVLLGYGLALGLPTGGDHEEPAAAPAPHADARIYELGPFLNGGVMLGDLELVGWMRFRIPTNQEAQDDVETSLGYDLSALYHLGPRVQALLELDGSGGLSGPATTRRTANLAPGLKVYPFAGSPLSIGLGAAVPLTHDREFDTRALVSAFYHF